MAVVNKLQGFIGVQGILGAMFFVLLTYIPAQIVLNGVCTEVVDGDSIIVADSSGREHRIRLNYIDAPELKQLSLDGMPIGQWSRNFLHEKVMGKAVSIVYRKRDIYGRILGKVIVDRDNIDLNQLMVESGNALIYPFSVFDSGVQRTTYLTSFYNAFTLRKGIWATDGLVDPKQYRKLKRSIRLDYSQYHD